MEGIKEKVTGLKENFSNIVDTYLKLAKVKTAEKLSSILSLLFVLILALFLLIFFLFFIGIAASIWLGHLINSQVGGFLIISGLYFLLTFLVLVLRKKVILPMIANLIIRKIYE